MLITPDATTTTGSAKEELSFTCVFYEPQPRPSGEWSRLTDARKWLCKPGSEFKSTKFDELRKKGLVVELWIDGMVYVDIEATRLLILKSQEPEFFKRRIKGYETPPTSRLITKRRKSPNEPTPL